MATKLTDAKIREIKPPERGQVEHADSEVPGLRVRIGRSGKPSFIVRKRIGGALRVVTLGPLRDGFGIRQARIRARALISDLEAGRPIAVPQAVGPGQRSLNKLLPLYIEARRDKRRGMGEVERLWRKRILPRLGDRQVEAITRADVRELVRSIARDHAATARNVRAELSAFYSKWALHEFDEIAENPCRDAFAPEKAKARDRVLGDDELAGLWTVSANLAWPWGAAVRLLILTGARRSEVFGAEWGEFDLDAGEWLIPGSRAKNHRDHLVPLSPAALEIVRGLPRHDSAKLFPTMRGKRAGEASVSGFSKGMVQIRQALDKELEREPCVDWALHDLRRTVATGMQRLGIRLEVTEAALNHVSGTRGGIVGVYQRYDWAAEKREAFEAWALEVERIARGAGNDQTR